ncbi:hypothetical protein DM860_013564 [Cuscuta australis]|uniref:Uncharacterized protein n=1 Tax=Cuscuta australis TaxID=267555 RepID=A0A328EDW0_9ASTE|nr:hypothetical protein DM860_013564 [Cuscuta australis]
MVTCKNGDICASEIETSQELSEGGEEKWVIRTSGMLTLRTTGLARALAESAATLMQSSESMELCAADSVSATMPRKLDSSSTARVFWHALWGN